MKSLFVSTVALATHAFVSGYGFKRSKQLLGKITTYFKGKFDSVELSELQSRIVTLIVTSAVNVKRCTRWRASALASSLAILKLDGFPSITEEILQALIVAEAIVNWLHKRQKCGNNCWNY